MSKYTLQTVVDDKVIKESALKIKNKDTLIAKVKYEKGIVLTNESITDIHKYIESALESESKLITLPDFVEIQVLSQSEN